MNSSADWIDHNGALLRAESPILTAGNRGFRYGDGLFETLLVQNGRIRLRDYHFERLFSGLRQLKFVLPAFFSAESLEAGILRLCNRNGHSALARVRLAIYRGNGGLYDSETIHPHYLIESWALTRADIALNTNGFFIDVYLDGWKACDSLANLKSSNFLLYVLAALYAKEHRLNDCLVLNSHQRLADSTIANLFYVKDNQLYTPSLSEGVVAGVMRRFLLSSLPGIGLPIHEQPVTVEDLQDADEIFLSNALRGIRWVGTFRTSRYPGDLSRDIYHQLINQLA